MAMNGSESNSDACDPGPGPNSVAETQAHDLAEAIVRVLDDYLADLKACRAPQREELLSRHPEIAPQLTELLAGLDFLHCAEVEPAAKRLGDFRIIRMVGRGGMGAVFEAEQVSLGRRVALKVLRFAGVSDAAAIERFQREAETVAKLHHTNIVPIFAVGSEGGVNYYAMQFIEGQSLADVARERRDGVAPTQAAEWGLQAAEALEHAHQRGVIHRDVKPSNLLLDPDGRLWLTDFGLARRLDDVTLSLTGVLLGTPRYMSPEQAAASTRRVDHRTDIFSLGATLYELISGRPAFGGETPHDVIQQILTGEPPPLRKVAPSIPRDLETIVAKCLSKEAGGRYHSARELASDLRAFLDGRPIHARRTSAVELAARWLKQHKRSVWQTGVAAAATLAVTIASLVGVAQYRQWNSASIRLDAVDPPLVAEFIDASGALIRTDTLPMQSAATMPSGERQLRVSAAGDLSQTFHVALERGQNDVQYKIDLRDHWLFSPLDIERYYAVVNFPGRDALALFNNDGAALHKSNGPAWDWRTTLSPEASPALAQAPGLVWPWTSSITGDADGFGQSSLSPWIAPATIDVDEDGVADVILAARHQAWLTALSGRTGEVLWFAGRARELGARPDSDTRYGRRMLTSAVLHEPVVVDDIDGDGAADLVVSMVELSEDRSLRQNRYDANQWIEAVSGKSGQTIWRRDVPANLFPTARDAPYSMRWFPGGAGSSMSRGGQTMSLMRHPVRGRGRAELTGGHVYCPDRPSLVMLGGRQRVAVVAGGHLLTLTLATGEPVEAPIDLGAQPGKPVVWADLDGDAEPEIVLIEEVGAQNQWSIPQAKLVAWSYVRQGALWSRRLDVGWPWQPNWTVDEPHWPLVVDLDGDVACEIIVPTRGSDNFGSRGGVPAHSTPWGEICALAGDTGEPRWTRKLVSMDEQIDHFIHGPDLSGDGVLELFATTLSGQPTALFVDALDGVTGKPFWTTRHDLHETRDALGHWQLNPPRWRNAGLDGWPQLLVEAISEQGDRKATLFAISAGTGALAQRGDGTTSVNTADLDGDGLDELLIYTADAAMHADHGGDLRCVRGLAAEPWKRLADLGEAIADLNGDGLRDFVRSWGDGTLVATSGATGRRLWQTRPVAAVSELKIASATSCVETDASARARSTVDLDGDGIADLLAAETSTGGRGRVAPLHAVSGRNGKLLWSLQDVAVRMIGGTLAATVCDLEGDGHPESLWLAACDFGYPEGPSVSTGDVQIWMFVASARDGRLLWSTPLSPAYGRVPASSPAFAFHDTTIDIATTDVNGDGSLDLLVPSILATGAIELTALDGRSGIVLWSRTRPADSLSLQSLRNWTSPTACDLNGDGTEELVAIEPTPLEAAGANGAQRQDVAVIALRAADGQALWLHDTDVVYTHFESYSTRRGELLRPAAVRGVGGRKQVAVLLPGGDGKLAVFGADGLVNERLLQFDSRAEPMQVCDLDGNGTDEVVFVHAGQVVAATPERLDKVVWERAIETSNRPQLLGVEPASESMPAVVVVAADATDNTVQGWRAATGETVWTCPGPIPRSDGAYLMLNALEVLGARPRQAPMVYFGHQFVGDCRQAALVDNRPATGEIRMSATSFAARGVAATPSATASVAVDSRWLRDLPWQTDASLGRIAAFVAWAIFFSIMLYMLPLCLIAWVAVKRRYDLRTLMLLPVAVAMIVSAAVVKAPQDNDFNSIAGRLVIGAVASPLVLGWASAAYWLLKRRWLRVAFCVACVLAASALSAAVSIAAQSHSAPLLVEESYDWSAWHQALLPGAFIASWLIIAALAAEGTVRWLGRLIARRRARRLGDRTLVIASESAAGRRPAPPAAGSSAGA